MKLINMVGVPSIGIVLIASSALAQVGDPRPGDPGYVEFPSSGGGFPGQIAPPALGDPLDILVHNPPSISNGTCYFNEDSPLTINFIAPSAGTTTLQIAAWDVDYPDDDPASPPPPPPLEHDKVYLNGGPIGRLVGGNEIWSVTTFPSVSVNAGLNTITIEIDVDNPVPGVWCTTVDWVFVDIQATPGVCVLDFEKEAEYENYPRYFNLDGFFDHPEDEQFDRGLVTRFLSCYEHMTKEECENSEGTQKRVEGQLEKVSSGHWYGWAEDCEELREKNILTDAVKLLATDVNLTATKNGSGVDLELTTSSEEDTAVLSILRGENVSEDGTKVSPVPGCDFLSGGSPYTCTDDVVGDNYRVLETEYDGELIVYDEVTPE